MSMSEKKGVLGSGGRREEEERKKRKKKGGNKVERRSQKCGKGWPRDICVTPPYRARHSRGRPVVPSSCCLFCPCHSSSPTLQACLPPASPLSLHLPTLTPPLRTQLCDLIVLLRPHQLACLLHTKPVKPTASFYGCQLENLHISMLCTHHCLLSRIPTKSPVDLYKPQHRPSHLPWLKTLARI